MTAVDEIRDQLAAAGDALARANRERQDAMIKVKAAVRAAKAVEIPITQISELAGITRPTIYKLLED